MKWGADMELIPFRLCLGKRQELFPGRKLRCMDDFGADLGMIPRGRGGILHCRSKFFSIVVSVLFRGEWVQLWGIFLGVFLGKIWLVLGI